MHISLRKSQIISTGKILLAIQSLVKIPKDNWGPLF